MDRISIEAGPYLQGEILGEFLVYCMWCESIGGLPTKSPVSRRPQSGHPLCRRPERSLTSVATHASLRPYPSPPTNPAAIVRRTSPSITLLAIQTFSRPHWPCLPPDSGLPKCLERPVADADRSFEIRRHVCVPIAARRGIRVQ